MPFITHMQVRSRLMDVGMNNKTSSIDFATSWALDILAIMVDAD